MYIDNEIVYRLIIRDEMHGMDVLAGEYDNVCEAIHHHKQALDDIREFLMIHIPYEWDNAHQHHKDHPFKRWDVEIVVEYGASP